MILVVGLGNPGPRYLKTRHNAGFLVVDGLHEQSRCTPWELRFLGQFAAGSFGGVRLGLLKPQTFMNRSGESVRMALGSCAVSIDELLVVHDDLDLPLGRLRLKQGGGTGGHRGLASITEHLNTPDYVRLRFGIGRPPADFEGDIASYVLEDFAATERPDLPLWVAKSVEAVVLVARDGLAAAMNQVNRRNTA